MTEYPQILRAGLFDQTSLWHGFTTKLLGADYDRIAVAMKALVSQIYYVEQVHGTDVVVIKENTELGELPPADALVTQRKDILIGVRTADCLPLLLFDEEHEVVAAIHAGYKGLLNGVIQNTLNKILEIFSSDPENLRVVIGPSICGSHYEVGEEIIHAFRQRYGNRFVFSQRDGAKPFLDLKQTAQKILEDEGIAPDAIEVMDYCTFEDEDLFYSYRRSQEKGRQFSFIGLPSHSNF